MRRFAVLLTVLAVVVVVGGIAFARSRSSAPTRHRLRADRGE